MNPRKCFPSSGTHAFAALLVLASSIFPALAAQAQSADSATAAKSVIGSAPFLVAPSIALSGTPSAVAMGDLNQDGKPDLVTIDTAAGKLTVFLGTGNGKFASGVEYAAGSHPTAVALADLKGDGGSEVILANEAEGSVSVFSAANGKLQLTQTIAAGLHPSLLAAGDFRGDGKPGVAVATKSGRSLAILLNDGDGKLQTPSLSSLGAAPTALTVGDFNRDSRSDLAFANADGSVSILLGSATGTFRSTPSIAVARTPLTSIVAGDFNHDGNLGLAVTTAGDKSVSVLAGKGDGSFAAPQILEAGRQPLAVSVLDFDGDGIADLLVLNQGSNTFSLLRGNGQGSFNPSQDFVVGDGPLAAVVGDLNGDGHPGVAVINGGSHTMSLALGNGDGTFKAGRSYTAEVQPRSVVSGILNASGTPALVVANYCGSDPGCAKGGTVDVFLAPENGKYALDHSYPVGAGPVAVALVDVDGDQQLDIVALNRDDKTISVLRGRGDGSFEQQYSLPLAEAPVGLAVADFNHDGKRDLAVLEDCGAAKCAQPGSVEFLLNQGQGSFRSAFSYQTGYAPVSIAAGDLNGDKQLDIAVANRCGRDASCKSNGTATVLLGSVSGKFTAAPEVMLGKSPSSIALADLSGRGVLDLVASRATDNTVATFHGNGDGSFAAASTYAVGNAPGTLAIADFNGDGVLDIAAINTADSTVSVLYGKPDGTLASAIAVPVGKGPESMTAIIVGNGHHASLATANANSGSSTPGTEVSVLFNPIVEVSGSTTTLTSTVGTTSNVNDSMKLTATVTGSGLTPAGFVKFFSNTGVGIPTCLNVSLDASGVATCTIANLDAGSYALSATYNGQGSTYSSSNSNVIAQTVKALAATLSMSAVATPTVDQSVTFTAMLTATSLTPVAPSGLVQFTINGVSSTDCPDTSIASGEAQCTTSSLVAPSNILTATYAGDSNFTVTPTTVTVPQAATKATPVTTLTTSQPGFSTVNQTVMFSAVVAPPSPGATTTQPTGSVTFSQGATQLCASSVLSVSTPKTATCSYAFSAVSTGQTITATYSDDTNFTAGAGGTVNQIVKQAATNISVASSSPTSVVNTQVTFTATLTGSPSGTAVPSAGTVIYYNTTTSSALCTVTITTPGVVPPCNFTFGTAGLFNIVANYTIGDTNFLPSNSTPIAQTVKSGGTTVSVTSGHNPSTVNQSVTLSATVTSSSSGSAKPNGTFVYFDNLTSAPLCSVPLASGVVPDCTFTFTQAGNHGIVGQFTTSDSNFQSANSSSLSQQVDATHTTTAFSTTPSTSAVNQNVTFNATVTPTVSGTASPAGTVAFIQGLTTLCSQSVTSGTGVASCSAALLATGSPSITATFTPSDSNFSTSSVSHSHTVTKSSTTTTVSSSPNPSAVNQSVSFSAVVTPSFSGATVPAGSVAFTDSVSGALCTSTLAADGSVPSCSATLNSQGTHNITATYSGNSNFFGSASTPGAQVVNTTGTATSLTSNNNAPTVNQTVVFSAVITENPSGSSVPTSGFVTFTDTTAAVQLCKNNITAGANVPPCSYAFSTSGVHNIQAVFTSTDSNFTSSSSSLYAVTVGPVGTGISLVSSLPTGSFVNQQVTFSATVTSSSAGSVVPQGTVVFTDQSANPVATLCSVALAANGSVPPCVALFATAGNHIVQAAFTSSNTLIFTNAVNQLTEKVSATPTTTALAASPSTSTVDLPVTFTATIAPSIPPPAIGGSNPTGNVTFTYVLNAATITLCGAAKPVSTTAGVSTAVCTTSIPQTGSFLVTATYASGDGNFTAGAPVVATQVVNPTATTVTVSTPSPTPSSVNQSVQFTGTVTSAVTDTGLTLPTGKVTFFDAGAGALCTSDMTNGAVNGCSAPLSTAGAHSITAVYNGDANFSASPTSAIVTQMVNATNTTVTVTSTPQPSIATRQATFTATVVPAFTGAAPTAPSGVVTFTVSQAGIPFPCIIPPNSLPVGAAPPYATTCSVIFPNTVNGAVSVTANYAGDTNFNPSPTSAVYSQIVENFALAVGTPTSATTPIYLTQGYNTNNDPFYSATDAIAATATSQSNFGDTINLTCAISNATGDVHDPTCASTSGVNAVTLSAAGTASLGYTLTASPVAATGAYTITITGVSKATNTLTQVATNTVYVVGLSGPLSLSPGATGTEDIKFNTAAIVPNPAPTTLSGFKCTGIVSATTGIPITNSGITCSFPDSSVNVGGDFTMVPVSVIVASGSAAAGAAPKTGSTSSVTLASFWAIPLFALIAWFSRRNSARRNFFRFLGMVLLVFAIGHAIGCGGSFTRPTTPTSTIPAGDYLIQVVATGNDNNNYYAVVPVTVN